MAGVGAGIDDAPGREKPSASAIAVMVDGRAHGHADAGRAGDAALDLVPVLLGDVAGRSSAQYFQASEPEPSTSPRQLPRSIGPAGTKIAGRSMRDRAHDQAGRRLVAAAHQHRAVDRIASAAAPRSPSPGSCGRASSSASRTARDSDIAGSSTGKPPACQTPRLTSSTRCLKCAWHGLMSRPGVDDRDHRLAGIVLAAVAHLLDARPVPEGTQIIHAEPTVRAQLFRLLPGHFSATLDARLSPRS